MAAKVPNNFRSWERKLPGARGPGNETARKRIGYCPSGQFAPGNEITQERQGLYRHDRTSKALRYGTRSQGILVLPAQPAYIC